MCLLALFFRAVDDAPVIVGANREVYYNRAGEPPALLVGPVPVLAGRDPVAGGTWLGVNVHGVLVAVTNRLMSRTPPQARSRGLLVRDLLACPSAATAVELAARELSSNRYAGCNLLCADQDRAVTLHAGDWLRVRPLPPGLHVLTAHDINDASDRRLGHALWWLSQRECNTSSQCIAALKQLCGQTGNSDPPMCLRFADRGTVSSSIIALRSPLTASTFHHAQGPPDQTPYADLSPLFLQLAAAAPSGG
jgi:uncharacterized protein with NRDE domain